MEKTLVEKNISLSEPESSARIEQLILNYLQDRSHIPIAPDDVIKAVREPGVESAASIRGAIWHLLNRHQIEFTEQFELTLRTTN